MQGKRTPQRGRNPRPQLPPDLRLVRLDPIADGGGYKAKFDIRINQDLELRELRLIYDATQGVWWVSAPVREYVRDGEKKYWPLADFPKHWHHAIRDLALSSYREKTQAAEIGGAQ